MILRKLQSCPYCESGDFTRLMRIGLMRLFPNGRHHECMACGNRYFLFLKKYALGLSPTEKP